MIEYYNEDCMEGMKRYGDKHFDLCICDPPYGLGECQKKVNQRSRKTDKWKNASAPQYGGGNWDNVKPPDEYFSEIKRVSINQIIWGANHFGKMAPSSGWVVWYKKRFDEVNDFSDAELAYTSFNKGVRLFHFPWIGFGAVNAKEHRIHPTQKPVKLYKWLLHNYAKQGDLILDTHVGSASSLIACYDMGFDAVGFELDKDYYKASKKRLNDFMAQGKLFKEDTE